MSQTGAKVRTGRKWKAAEAVGPAESRLRHRVLVGTVARGRAGLSTSTTPCNVMAQGKVGCPILHLERFHCLMTMVTLLSSNLSLVFAWSLICQTHLHHITRVCVCVCVKFCTLSAISRSCTFIAWASPSFYFNKIIFSAPLGNSAVKLPACNTGSLLFKTADFPIG